MRASITLLLAACTPLEVAVELEEACVSRDAVPIAGTEASSATAWFVVGDLGTLQELAEIDGVMLLDRIVLRPVDEPGLDVEVARVTLESPDLPALEIACGDEAPCMVGTDIVLVAGMLDVAAYIRSGAITVTLVAWGQLPDRLWLADVEVCLAAELTYDLP